MKIGAHLIKIFKISVVNLLISHQKECLLVWDMSFGHRIIQDQMQYDKDEDFLKEKGVLHFPLCSMVYYPVVEDLQGGQLHQLI